MIRVPPKSPIYSPKVSRRSPLKPAQQLAPSRFKGKIWTCHEIFFRSRVSPAPMLSRRVVSSSFSPRPTGGGSEKSTEKIIRNPPRRAVENKCPSRAQDAELKYRQGAPVFFNIIYRKMKNACLDIIIIQARKCQSSVRIVRQACVFMRKNERK